MNNLSIKFRPIKIGWCIRNDDTGSLIHAMKLSVTLWGGCFNVLIPIDNKILAKKLIKEFRVDLLFDIKDGEVTENNEKICNWLGSPFIPDLPFLDGKMGNKIS